MQCPFLRKLHVKFCGLRRQAMIPLSEANIAVEGCAGARHRNCALLRDRGVYESAGDCCPHLSVADVHYCAMAPVRKLIPCNRTAVSRCTDAGHRHCRLYLAVADPPSDGGDDGEIPLPPSLAYTANHMWLDRGDGWTCHVGVDAFFARTLGRLDGIAFPHDGDGVRPVVRFTVGDVALDLVFPVAMRRHEVNTHLVGDPGEVMRDPYGRGWLWAGSLPPAAGPGATNAVERGMYRGEEARRWLDRERDRLAAFVHENLPAADAAAGPMLADGGRVRGDLVDVLDAAALLRLHAEFFTAGRP